MSHINIGKQFPGAYQAMLALDAQTEAAIREAGLPPLLADLVKIRASQLNGCAYCLRMHTRVALEHGETADRLAVLAAWWESQYFTPAERAALRIAEEVTRIAEAHDRASEPDTEQVLDDRQIAAVTWLAITINGWNRVAVSSHYAVAP